MKGRILFALSVVIFSFLSVTSALGEGQNTDLDLIVRDRQLGNKASDYVGGLLSYPTMVKQIDGVVTVTVEVPGHTCVVKVTNPDSRKPVFDFLGCSPELDPVFSEEIKQ